jgi:hypothetical protein
MGSARIFVGYGKAARQCASKMASPSNLHHRKSMLVVGMCRGHREYEFCDSRSADESNGKIKISCLYPAQSRALEAGLRDLSLEWGKAAIFRQCAAILTIASLLNACEPAGPSPSDATLSWIIPTKNTDGSPIQDLAGYYIYYGDSPIIMTHAVRLSDPASAIYVVRDLSPGPHYFSVAAYSASGAQSGLTPRVSKVIP